MEPYDIRLTTVLTSRSFFFSAPAIPLVVVQQEGTGSMFTSRVLLLAACFAFLLETAGGTQRHEGATSVALQLLSFAHPPPPSWRRTGGGGIGQGLSVLRTRGGGPTGNSSQPAAASIPCILECDEIWGRGSRKKFMIQDWLAVLGHDRGPGELVKSIGSAFDCSISMIQVWHAPSAVVQMLFCSKQSEDHVYETKI